MDLVESALLWCDLGQVLSLSEPQCCHLEKRDNLSPKAAEDFDTKKLEEGSDMLGGKGLSTA